MIAELDRVEAGTAARGCRLRKTTRRVLTRRGVVWLGQTCNLRCYFCYFLNRIGNNEHPEHPFMSLEKAKAICGTLRHFYGNTAVDLQGGEPTIYPEILELVRYCRDIGLYPTLITNGLALAKPGALERFREAGVRDYLVSLHGIGEIHDQVVGRKGAYEKITVAIGRMRELGIPFRFNCTMSKPVVPLLPEIAGKAIEFGAWVVNYIAFNPFEDQKANVRTQENVPMYSEIRPRLAEAMELLENAAIETNVRYLPLCIGEPPHRKNFYNFQQLPYDIHEWDYQSWMWTGLHPQRMRDGNLVPPFRLGPYADRVFRGDCAMVRDNYERRPLRGWIRFTGQRCLARLVQTVRGRDILYREEAQYRAAHEGRYQYHEGCMRCSMKGICDGFHGDYAELFGTGEAVPITDEPPTDIPLHYVGHQEKIVEPEDERWAL